MILALIIIITTCLIHALYRPEHFACEKRLVKLKKVLPVPFDPYAGASKMQSKTYVYSHSNPEFQKLLTTTATVPFNTKETVLITDEEVKKNLQDMIANSFLKQNPQLLQSGYRYINAIMQECRTDYSVIFAEVFCVMHVPSTAYGRSVKITAQISIMDNSVTRLSASLYGSIAASDIAQLSSSS